MTAVYTMHFNVLVKVNSVRSKKKGTVWFSFSPEYISMRNSSGSVEVTPRESADRKMRAERLFDTFSSEQYAMHPVQCAEKERKGRDDGSTYRDNKAFFQQRAVKVKWL